MCLIYKTCNNKVLWKNKLKHTDSSSRNVFLQLYNQLLSFFPDLNFQQNLSFQGFIKWKYRFLFIYFNLFFFL